MSEVRCKTTRLSEHVLQIAVPTPTLPPSFETNTYVVHNGHRGILVDAGSQDVDVLMKLVAEIQAQGITHVETLIATHYHRDHTQGLPYLQNVYGAPIHIHTLDRQPALREMSGQPSVAHVQPSYVLDGLAVTVEHHPGHTHGHLHVLVSQDGVILVGDHLAGDGSVWIGPPDGHMADYFRALDAISVSGCEIAGPGHGMALHDAAAAASTIRRRREARENEIEAMVYAAPQTVQGLVQVLYASVIPKEALWVAKKTVQAHLQHLIDGRRVVRRYTPNHGFTYHPNSAAEL